MGDGELGETGTAVAAAGTVTRGYITEADFDCWMDGGPSRCEGGQNGRGGLAAGVHRSTEAVGLSRCAQNLKHHAGARIRRKSPSLGHNTSPCHCDDFATGAYYSSCRSTKTSTSGRPPAPNRSHEAQRKEVSSQLLHSTRAERNHPEIVLSHPSPMS